MNYKRFIRKKNAGDRAEVTSHPASEKEKQTVAAASHEKGSVQPSTAMNRAGQKPLQTGDENQENLPADQSLKAHREHTLPEMESLQSPPEINMDAEKPSERTKQVRQEEAGASEEKQLPEGQGEDRNELPIPQRVQEDGMAHREETAMGEFPILSPEPAAGWKENALEHGQRIEQQDAGPHRPVPENTRQETLEEQEQQALEREVPEGPKGQYPPRYPILLPNAHAFVEKCGDYCTDPTDGYTPQQIRNAYQLTAAETGAGKTIALIEASYYPELSEDLKVFSQKFGLPEADLEIIRLYEGDRPYQSRQWQLEAAMDVQWAHAMAPEARLLCVVSNGPSFDDLMKAVQYADAHSADIISMSWGVEEFSGQESYEDQLASIEAILIAASGDAGGRAFYPSSSVHVLSVGGTTLRLTADGKRIGQEEAWQNSGGGPSKYQVIPTWQKLFSPISTLSGNMRATPDVAFLGNPQYGVLVYHSLSEDGTGGWAMTAGTSLGAPCFAGIAASLHREVFNGYLGRNLPQYLYTIAGGTEYANPQYYFHDVKVGSNTRFEAMRGFDLCTGLGTPIARQIVLG